MKKTLRSGLLAVAAIMAIHSADAQSKLIHYWNFNNLTVAYHNPGIPAIKADYSAIDTNKAQIVYKLATGASSTYAGYIDNVAGDTTNAKLGAVAGNALRVRNPSDSMELRFYIPTTNYKNIVLKYALQSSSVTSGQLAELFDYSVDSGATWKTTGLSMTIDSVSQAQYQSATGFGLVSLNFYNDTTTYLNSKLVFRIKFAGNTALTSGNNRFDNVTVQGDTSTAATIYGNTIHPTGVASVNNGASIYQLSPNPVTGDFTINSAAAAEKTITIFDASGKKVYAVKSNDTKVSIATTNWNAGLYYVNIVTANGVTSTLRMIKQ